MADSDAVVVSEAVAREAGSSKGRDESCGPTAPREARYLSAAAGWELGAPGAGQEGAGQVRAGRVRARGFLWGRGPGVRDFPLWKRSRAGGSREKRSAVAALQPRPRGQARGQRLRSVCAWRGACRPPTPALLPRWAATLNLIRPQEPGDHQRLRPGGKAGFCFAVI